MMGWYVSNQVKIVQSIERVHKRRRYSCDVLTSVKLFDESHRIQSWTDRHEEQIDEFAEDKAFGR